MFALIIILGTIVICITLIIILFFIVHKNKEAQIPRNICVKNCGVSADKRSIYHFVASGFIENEK